MSTPAATPPPAPLSNREIRDLKARAQHLNAVTKLGKSGLSPEFLAAVDVELNHHGLIKIKLTEQKDQRHELADQIAQKTASQLICVIGHVIVIYRPKRETEPGPTTPTKPDGNAARRTGTARREKPSGS